MRVVRDAPLQLDRVVLSAAALRLRFGVGRGCGAASGAICVASVLRVPPPPPPALQQQPLESEADERAEQPAEDSSSSPPPAKKAALSGTGAPCRPAH